MGGWTAVEKSIIHELHGTNDENVACETDTVFLQTQCCACHNSVTFICLISIRHLSDFKKVWVLTTDINCNQKLPEVSIEAIFGNLTPPCKVTCWDLPASWNITTTNKTSVPQRMYGGPRYKVKNRIPEQFPKQKCSPYNRKCQGKTFLIHIFQIHWYVYEMVQSFD